MADKDINVNIEIENFNKFLTYKLQRMHPELYKEFKNLPVAVTINDMKPPWESRWTCPSCKKENVDRAEGGSLIRRCGYCRQIVRVS